ncbi:MAG: ATP-binding cassette domain-containing protein [Chloroflexi bacterium]|nr:ATP-binding cassette domain-containing protein [Chloroflexota bacterium]
MIIVRGLTFSYADQTPIFENLHWHVAHGEAWSVIGPSGCGKTTLLYLLAGLLHPTKGEVLVDGQPLQRPRPRTGLILQDYGLLPWATVAENAALGLRVRQFYGPDGRHAPRSQQVSPPAEKVDFWLKRLGIDRVRDHYPVQISGGQRQRTAIARTLAMTPDLLLMDEPFSSIDALTREELQDLTLALREETALTTVLVTHSIEEAAFLGRRILVLPKDAEQEPQIVENPQAGAPAYRGSAPFHAVCDRLRERLAP